MVKGFLIIENIIGLVLMNDNKIMLVKTYAPVKTGLTKLCSDIKSAGENAEWYCTFTESIVDTKRSIVHSIINDKNVGITQQDFDVIKFILKECSIFNKMNFVSLLDLYAQHFDSTACLYSINGSIVAAVVDNGNIQAIDYIPFSNYNLYLSKLANLYEFKNILNMDNYSDTTGDYAVDCTDEGIAHLLTIMEWIQEANCISLLQYEGADLTVLDDDIENEEILKSNEEKIPDNNGLMEYEDEEVITSTRARPSRPRRNNSGDNPIDRFNMPEKPIRPKRTEQNYSTGHEDFYDENQKEDVKERPKRQNISRPRRPNTDENKKIKAQFTNSRPCRQESNRDMHEQVNRSSSNRAVPANRPKRSRPLPDPDDGEYHVDVRQKGRRSRIEHKAVEKKSNALLMLLLVIALSGGTLDVCNRFIMGVFQNKTTDTITNLNTAIDDAQEDIDAYTKINDLISSYDTTLNLIK